MHNNYVEQIQEWGYCYCHKCDQIRYSAELEAGEKGIECSVCGSDDIEAPAWVYCPHEKVSAVKCPRGGRGIVKKGSSIECLFRCAYRKV